MAEKILPSKSIDEVLSRIPDDVYAIVGIFAKNGYECYPVGGAVRDILLDRQPAEYDLTTNATPEQVASLFRSIIPTGIKHGTVTLLWNDLPYEITTYRTEGKYSDMRHPDEVRYAQTLDEDLSRRDFTINALALDLKDRRLVDNFQGVQDLKLGVIRTIGEPEERFREDGLRILRACRFASTLGFSIEPRTLSAIGRLAGLINNISMERVRDEFQKIVLSSVPSVGLELLRETGLMKFILPELLDGYGAEQNIYHKFDVYYHNIGTLDAAAKLTGELAIRLAALLHDVGKPRTMRGDGKNNTFYNHEMVGSYMSKAILRRLRFPNTIVARSVTLIKNHMFHFTDDWTDAAVRRFMRKADGIMEDLFILREADRVGSGKKQGNSRILERLKDKIKGEQEAQSAFKITDLAVNGTDVMAVLKIKPSKKVGEILEQLMEIVIEDPSQNTRENLLEKIKQTK